MAGKEIAVTIAIVGMGTFAGKLFAAGTSSSPGIDEGINQALAIGKKYGIPEERIRLVYPLVKRAAYDFDLDLALMMAVIHKESTFNPEATNPSDPSYGLAGIQAFWIDGRLGIRGTEQDLLRAEFSVTALANILLYYLGRHSMMKPRRVFKLPAEIDVHQRGETQFLKGNRNLPYRDAVAGFYRDWSLVR